jgi:hypothetical protein
VVWRLVIQGGVFEFGSRQELWCLFWAEFDKRGVRLEERVHALGAQVVGDDAAVIATLKAVLAGGQIFGAINTRPWRLGSWGTRE